MWPVSAILESVDFHHHREFHCLLKCGLWTSSFSITESLSEMPISGPCPAYRFRIWILTKWNKISRVSLKFVKHCSVACILLIHLFNQNLLNAELVPGTFRWWQMIREKHSNVSYSSWKKQTLSKKTIRQIHFRVG